MAAPVSKPPARRWRQSLAAPASRFIGRAADVAAITRLLEQGARLVTLWGPAGMGKTRLSQEIALAWAAAHPDDAVRFCEVEEARDLKAFCGAVARAIGLAIAAGKKDAGTVDRIGRALAAEGPALVVLDNLEQVLEAAAPAVEAWLRAAPEARFLVTSRERTRLRGEASYELSPLGLPDGDRVRSDAVELFLDRANAERAGRPLGEESLPKVAALVRRLEGIPLAIELAAARADVLGLDGLLARLERRLDLLGGGLRGVEARQATLRSAIAWSWDLLHDADRRALACCSIFRGGFTLDAADAVLGEEALDRIQSLRDKSLLRAAPGAPGRAIRFSLYEGVRELAAEKLGEMGEAAAAGDRHAAHYLAAGAAWAASYERTGAVDALDRIGDELENLLAVVDRALAAPPSRAAAEQALAALLAVDPVLGTRGPFGIHLELYDRALDAARASGADPLLEARALAARGRARSVRGHGAAGLTDLADARARVAALGAADAEAGILTDLGVLHHARREMAAARACYEEALAIHRRAGDRRAEGRVLGNLGALHHDERRFDEAMRHYEPALAIAAAAGDRRTEGIFTTNVGLLEQERGAPAEARRRYERAVEILEEVGDTRLLAITLGNLGILHHEEGRLADARACQERAGALLREVGDRHSEALALGRLCALLASQGNGEEAAVALERGERLLDRLDDPIGHALLRVAGGFLHIFKARTELSAGRVDDARGHVVRAREIIDRARAGAPSLADRSDDVRLCLRILERDLSSVDDAPSPAGGELLIAPEASWCRPPGGAWQDLRDRQAVRRILLRLIEHQREAPGRGLSLQELQIAGWPGERILPAAASNRIYVAMNQLRKLGLKDLLRKGGDGYFLDPGLPVHFTAAPPA
jgi:predicted ATPase/Tfp pilus assembly protein PilF